MEKSMSLMIHKACIIFSLFIMPFYCFCQADSQINNEILVQKGKSWLQKGENDSLLQALVPPLQIEQVEPDTFLKKMYFLVGSAQYAKGKYQDAVSYIKAGNKLNAFIEDHHFSLKTKLILGNAYALQGALQEAEKTLDLVNAMYEKHPQLDSSFVGKLKRLEGNIFYKKGEYLNAIDCYEKALVNFQKYDKHPSLNVATINNNLGTCYNRLHDYEKAISFLDKSIAINRELYSRSSKELISEYINLGDALSGLKFFYKSENYYTKALTLAEKHQIVHAQAIIYNNLSYNALAQGQYKSAKLFAEKAIKLRKQNGESSSFSIITPYNNLAAAEMQFENMDKVMLLLDTCLLIYHKNLPQGHPFLITPLTNLARINIDRENFAKAKNLLNQASSMAEKFLGQNSINRLPILHLLSHLAIEENDFNTAQDHTTRMVEIMGINPDSSFDKMKYNWGDMLSFYYILNHRLYRKKYTESGDIEDLKKEHYFIRRAIDWSEYIKKLYHNDLYTTKINEIANLTYAEGIKSCLSLYEKEKNDSLFEEALNLVEMSKAFKINQYLNLQDASANGLIPINLYYQEQKLYNQLNEIQNQLYALESNVESKKNVIDSLSKILEHKKSENAQFIESLSEKYPQYYSLKYSTRKFTLDEVLNIIDHYECPIVTYMETEDEIIILLLKKNGNKYWIKKKPDDFSDLINQHTTFIESRNDADFYKNSVLLYQLLWEDINPYIESDKTIVIPSQQIGYVNFETLINPINGHYLIEDFNIYHNFSLSTLINSSADPLKIEHLSSFYPEYAQIDSSDSKSSHDFSDVISDIYRGEVPILHRSETDGLSKKLSSNDFIGPQATKKNFISQGLVSDVLHLSGHSIYDESNPFNSLFLFSLSEDKMTDNILKLGEIYGMQFNAKMVMISGCNTALGSTIKGEGIINYCHAFSTSGVPINGISLWSIPEQSTYEIMTDFYRSINENEPIANTLRTIKLNFIHSPSVKEYQHPFFWGGMVLYGPPEKIIIEHQYLTPVFIGMIFLSLLSLVIFLIKKK